MKKAIELTIEQAIELYKQNPEYRTNILSTFTDEELGLEVRMRSWEELDFTNVYVPSRSGQIDTYIKQTYDRDLSTPSEKHALSMIAFAKLSMLMKDLGSECEVDWNDVDTLKHCIKYSQKTNLVYLSYCYTSKHFLAFKSEEKAIRFMVKHTELIKQYYGY